MMGDPTKVLVPVDGSDHADHAVSHAIRLAKLGQALEVHILNVQPPLTGDVASFIAKPTRDDYHREEAEKVLAGARELLAKAGVAFKEHICVGRPGPSIVAFARQLGCGQIVMGTHGSGAALKMVLGSVAADVVRDSPVPVTVVK